MRVAQCSGMSEMFKGVNRLRGALDYHVTRHNVLSSNIANAETPGFHPAELLRERDDSGFGPTEDRTTAPGANGNAVSLEHEMAKLAANDVRFEGAVKIVSQQLAMLRYASNDGSGG
jgi:flagellar basal-body rod protein FlgB